MFEQFAGGKGEQKRPFYLGYGMAILVVALAAVVPPAFFHWGGVALPYVSFYPAVILVALLFGRGPGLLTAILSAFVANYWIEPMGGFWISSPVQGITMSLFVAANQ